jgi:hypothetical protein
MKRTLLAVTFSIITGLLAIYPAAASAQGRFESVSGAALTNAVPNDFYLEGNRIPVEKRNSVLLKDSSGGRVVVGLIDTTAYSSKIRTKYMAFVITEAKISLGGIKLGVGSYGIGLDLPGEPTKADGSIKVYNQAGEKLGEGTLKRDESVKLAKPLSVSADKTAPTKLLFGKYVLVIE